jgi:hypothetical protein
MTGKIYFYTFALALQSSCTPSDPGWDYTSQEGRRIEHNGARYELNETHELRPTIYGGAFAGSLTVRLSIENTGTDLVKIDPTTAVKVEDASGTPLKAATPTALKCRPQETPSGAPQIMKPNGSCEFLATFRIQPFDSSLSGFFGRRNPQLERITIHLDPPLTRLSGSRIHLPISLFAK